MKITFILPGYPWKPIGGFRVIYEYANHLVAKGHDITVVHARRLPNWSPPPPNFYRWLRRKAGQVRNLICRPKIHWQPIDKRVKIFYVPEPTEQYIPDADIVFATWWPTAELILNYPQEKGHKFYLVQDFYPYMGTKSEIENSWKLPLKKIVVSSWLYDMVLNAGVSKDDVFLIPNGIDHNRFNILKDITERPKRVGMMYSNSIYKASEDGLKALEICKNKHPDLQVILFGPYRPKKLPLWAEFRRNVNDEELVRIYNSCRIFISSSLAEGFAFPPAEAMACGCAVVATDSGGIREYAKHEETALLSPPGDPDMLAKNLIRLLEDDQLRVKIAKAGHEKIKEFTWERSTKLLEKLLIEEISQ